MSVVNKYPTAVFDTRMGLQEKNTPAAAAATAAAAAAAAASAIAAAIAAAILGWEI